MPQIGTLEYPDTSIDDVIESAKKIARQFKSAEFDRAALAAALGYKNARSGTFNARLADLRRFGIVDGRADGIRATDLAQRIAAPATQDEYAAAVSEAAFRIPLYKVLYEHYQGETPSEEDLFATLLNITKADRIDAQKQAGRIKTLFGEVVSRAEVTAIGTAPRSHGTPAPGTRTRLPQAGSGEELLAIEFHAGQIHQSFPFTPEGVDQLAVILKEESFWKFLRAQALGTPKPSGGPDRETGKRASAPTSDPGPRN